MSLHQTPQYHRKAVVRQDPKEEVTNLKQQPGKDISISGSAALVRSLLRDGFLDELRLMVHPVVVGGGKRLFEDGGDQRALELVDSKTFGTGVLYLTYQLGRADAYNSRITHRAPPDGVIVAVEWQDARREGRSAKPEVNNTQHNMLCDW